MEQITITKDMFVFSATVMMIMGLTILIMAMVIRDMATSRRPHRRRVVTTAPSIDRQVADAERRIKKVVVDAERAVFESAWDAMGAQRS